MAADDFDGLLSQDDIDAALAEAGYDSGGQSPSESPAPPSDDGGSLSQDDIDAALAAAGNEAGAVTPDAGGGDAGGEDAGGMSQADIDAALSEAGTDERVDSCGRPFDEVAAAMAAAIQSEQAAGPSESADESLPPLPSGMAYEAPPLEAEILGLEGIDPKGIDLLRDVQLDVKIELGRSRMLVDDVLRLGQGSVVELDKLAGDPVDVFVNDRLVARGEVLVLNDNFCVRINDIVREDEEEAAENMN